MKRPKTSAKSDNIHLYYFPRTRAVRARWLLEEIGISYQLHLIDLRRKKQKTEEYLAVHPLGKVPALLIDRTTIFESLAICLYLADRFCEAGLAPAPADRVLRANYYKWMSFSSGTLEPALFEQIRLQKEKQTTAERIGLGSAATPFKDVTSYIDQTLATQPFLLGQNFSAADIMNGSQMMWADRSGLLTGLENLKRWIDCLRARQAFQRANSMRWSNVHHDK